MAKKQPTEKGLHHAVAREFVKSTLGPRPEERKKTKESREAEPSFEERPEAEQVELMYTIHSLVDEQKLLTQSLRSTEKERHVEGVFDIKKVAGRFITVPIPSEGTEHELYDKVAVAQTKDRLEHVKAELKDMGNIPGLHEAYEKKLVISYYLVKVAKTTEIYRARVAAIDRSIEQLSKQAKESASGSLTGVKGRQFDMLKQERDDLARKITDFESTLLSHEGADRQLAETQHLSRISEYAESYERGYMVEFPSARKTVHDLLNSMRLHQTRLLVGHLGSGKTAMARHAAKLFMLENGIGYDPSQASDINEVYKELKPEFFSGSEEASVYDLMGKLKIESTGGDLTKLAQNVEQISKKLQRLKKSKIDIPKEEIAKALLGKSDVVETIFSYGPVGRAIKEGKPIIIDEINRMPAEVLSRANDYFSVQVGEKVNIQENGGELFEIKPGFVVIATANRGREYNVKKMELSMKYRLPEIQVDYPEVEETYDLMTAALVRKDRPRLPEKFPVDQYDKLADLAVATREIQEVFAGQTVGLRFMSMINRADPERTALERSVISTRDLMRNVIGTWKDGNFSQSLDEVVAEQILKTNREDKVEQKFMTEIFMRRGFFEGWSSEQFKQYNIDVSDKEIQVLQAQMDTKEYKEADQRFGELQSEAHERANLAKANLLIGYRRQES